MLNILPPKAREIVETLLTFNENTPVEMLALGLYIEVAKNLCWNRVMIEDKNGNETIPNIYGIVLAPSGSGKDRTITLTNWCSELVHKEQQLLIESYYNISKNSIENHIENNPEQFKTSAQKQKFRNDHEPYALISVSGDGTPEGLNAKRKEFEKAKFGATHFQNTEFVDYVKSDSGAKFDLMTLLKDLFESGNSNKKDIQSNKGDTSVKGVPQTMFVLSSMSGLVDDQKTSTKFKEFFGRGASRRYIVCVPEKKDYKIDTSFEEKEEREKQALKKFEEEIKPYFLKIHKNTEINLIGFFGENKCIEEVETIPKKIALTDEAKRKMFEYYQQNKRKINLFSSKINESEELELLDRSRRALKVSAGIAVLEHPEQLEITLEDYEYAIKFVNFYAEQIKRALFLERILDSEKLYNFILENQDKYAIKKMLIYKQSFAPTHKGSQKKWLEETLDEVEEICEEQKMRLIREKEYKIIQPTILCEDDPVIHLSIANHDDENRATGFNPFTVQFLDLAEAITKKMAYSPDTFVGGHRTEKCSLKTWDSIIIDIDNKVENLNAREASEIFKNVKSLIITTKRNTARQNRYRIILPLNDTVIPQNCSYKTIQNRIIEHFGITKYIDKTGTTGDASWFHASPGGNGSYHYSESNRVVNWRIFDKPEGEAKKINPDQVKINPNKTLPKTQTFRLANTQTWKQFKEFEYLKVGDKAIPVHCWNESGHNNGDRKASGFIKRSPNGLNNLVVNCSGCNEFRFIDTN